PGGAAHLGTVHRADGRVLVMPARRRIEQEVLVEEGGGPFEGAVVRVEHVAMGDRPDLSVEQVRLRQAGVGIDAYVVVTTRIRRGAEEGEGESVIAIHQVGELADVLVAALIRKIVLPGARDARRRLQPRRVEDRTAVHVEIEDVQISLELIAGKGWAEPGVKPQAVL